MIIYDMINMNMIVQLERTEIVSTDVMSE